MNPESASNAQPNPNPNPTQTTPPVLKALDIEMAQLKVHEDIVQASPTPSSQCEIIYCKFYTMNN